MTFIFNQVIQTLPARIRSKEREPFQVFSMTSEGPVWRLYVCYLRRLPEVPLWLQDPEDIPPYVSLDNQMRKTCFLTFFQKDMKMFWEGDITNEKMAWQLHCLVDQMHVWAIKPSDPSS